MIQHQIPLPRDHAVCACPSCKQPPALYRCDGGTSSERFHAETRYQIECARCGTRTARFETVAAAITAWRVLLIRRIYAQTPAPAARAIA